MSQYGVDCSILIQTTSYYIDDMVTVAVEGGVVTASYHT